jgi:hypothetical protein
MANLTKTNIDDTAHRIEAIGSWDHGVEGIDTVNSSAEDGSHKIEGIQDFLKCVSKAIGSGIEKLKEDERRHNGILHDRALREKYREHTEEIVAGEKMAVKSMIHEHSFDAP